MKHSLFEWLPGLLSKRSLGEGGGSIPVACAFLYLDVIFHGAGFASVSMHTAGVRSCSVSMHAWETPGKTGRGLVSHPLACIGAGVCSCPLACMHGSRRRFTSVSMHAWETPDFRVH